MPKKLLASLFSYDINGARNLSKIMQRLLSRGHRILHATLNTDLTFDILNPRPDVLLINIASFKNDHDLQLLEKTISANPPIPTIIIADTYNTCTRPIIQDLNLQHAIAIVAGPHEIQSAKELGYSDAFFFGGPPIWSDWFSLVPAEINRNDDKKIIVVGVIKDARLTDILLQNVVNAIKSLSINSTLILRLHPNEQSDAMNDGRRQEILQDMKWNTAPEFDTERVVVAADLAIFPNRSTPMITAAHMRIPAISFSSDELKTSSIKQSGSSSFHPIDAGAILSATTDTLEQIIHNLIVSSSDISQLKEKQEKIYPVPAPGKSPAEQIVHFMEKQFLI